MTEKDLIYIKHPTERCNVQQAERISKITDPAELAMCLYIFNSGNATFKYHQLSDSQEVTPELYEMWLEGLEEPMKSDFAKRGFDANKRVLSFTRFVMEMADVGMDEFVLY